MSELFYVFIVVHCSLGQYAFCRAVISFKKPDDVFLFREKFDNYVFVDPRGKTSVLYKGAHRTHTEKLSICVWCAHFTDVIVWRQNIRVLLDLN